MAGTCVLLSLSLFFIASLTRADDDTTPYTFATLAGSPGIRGSADGTGSEARFYNPSSVAVDGSGNVYVADTANSTIRKITPDGVVTTFAGQVGHPGPGDGTGNGNSVTNGDGTGSTSQFFEPQGVATDAKGNIYVADTRNDTIRKITPDGVVTTVAGVTGFNSYRDGPASAAGFFYPSTLAVDSTGTIYVCDAASMIIRRITPDGVVSTLAGSQGDEGSTDGRGTEARFYYPHGLTVDAKGNIYVTDTVTKVIRKITPDGWVSTFAGHSHQPGGAADGQGSAAVFSTPCGVAADRQGNLYVADSGNSTIRMITPDGVVTTLGGGASRPGSVDGTGADARFNQPRGIAVDGSGNLYIADTFNQTIRVGTRHPESPTINFPRISDQIYGFGSVRLAATSSAAGPMIYVVVSGPGIISGHVLNFTGVGEVTVRAEQGGTAMHGAASATQTFRVQSLFRSLAFEIGLVLAFGLGAFYLSRARQPGSSLTTWVRATGGKRPVILSFLCFALGFFMLALFALSPRFFQPPSPSPFERGLDAYYRSDYKRAIEEFSSEIALHPQDAAAYVYRSKAQEMIGQYDEAIADAAQAKQIAPSNAEADAAQKKAAEMKGYLDANQRAGNKFMIESSVYTGFKELKDNTFPDDSLRHFDEAVKLKPDWALAYYGRGLAYERKGEPDQAAPDFKRAAELDPSNADVYSARREGPNASQDFASAVEKGAGWVADIYARDGDDWIKDGPRSEAYTAYYQALLLDPQCMRGYLGYGRYEEGMGHYDWALTNFAKALKLDPKSAEIYYYRGQTLAKMGQLDKAMADFDQALVLGLKTAGLYYDRGNTNFQEAQYDQAIADLTQSIQLNPQYAPAYFSRGYSYQKKGNDDSALADCNQAIALDAGYGPAYDMRGEIEVKRGQNDRALADFNDAINSRYLWSGYYEDRGNLYLAKNDFDHAITDFTLAIQTDPQGAVGYDDRGWAYFNKGEKDKAVADFNSALQFNPKDAVALNDLGWSSFTQGDNDKAIAYFTSAIQADPKFLNPYFNRRDAYNKVGQHGKAAEDAAAIKEIQLTGNAPSPPANTNTNTK
jgi:tetratricopeptide (TPR) repeat protein/sugar lactone lactonase YvrE